MGGGKSKHDPRISLTLLPRDLAVTHMQHACADTAGGMAWAEWSSRSEAWVMGNVEGLVEQPWLS